MTLNISVPLGVDKLAKRLPEQESGKIVDAEFIQWIVVTNGSGCAIEAEYMTTMDGLYMVNILVIFIKIIQVPQNITITQFLKGSKISTNYATFNATG